MSLGTKLGNRYWYCAKGTTPSSHTMQWTGAFNAWSASNALYIVKQMSCSWNARNIRSIAIYEGKDCVENDLVLLQHFPENTTFKNTPLLPAPKNVTQCDKKVIDTYEKCKYLTKTKFLDKFQTVFPK